MAGRSARLFLRSSTHPKRPRSRRRSRVRRFRLIPRTSRQPRVVQEVRVGIAPLTRESRNHARFRPRNGETRTRTGDTTIFSRVAQRLKFGGFAGDSRGFGIAWPSRTCSDFAALSRLLGPTGRLVGLFATSRTAHRQPGSWHSRRRRQARTLIVLPNPLPRFCWTAMWRYPRASSSRARRSSPASTGRRPPSEARRLTMALASSSSEATNTSSGGRRPGPPRACRRRWC